MQTTPLRCSSISWPLFIGLFVIGLCIVPPFAKAQIVTPAQQKNPSAQTVPTQPAPVQPAPLQRPATPSTSQTAVPAANTGVPQVFSPPSTQTGTLPNSSNTAASNQNAAREAEYQKMRRDLLAKFGVTDDFYSPFLGKSREYKEAPPEVQSKATRGEFRISVSGPAQWGKNDQKTIQDTMGWSGNDIKARCQEQYFGTLYADGYSWQFQVDERTRTGTTPFAGVPDAAQIFVMLSCDANGRFPDYNALSSVTLADGTQLPRLPPPDLRGPLVNGKRSAMIAQVECAYPKPANGQTLAPSRLSLNFIYSGDSKVACQFL